MDNVLVRNRVFIFAVSFYQIVSFQIKESWLCLEWHTFLRVSVVCLQTMLAMFV